VLAEPWPEASRNFRSDPRWLGGDGASTVDLGEGRVLWLFGDSFVDPAGTGDRRRAHIVRNSVAVQTGTDPALGGVAFFWGRGTGGEPEAFFPSPGPRWYWPGDGIVVQGRLVVFLMNVGAADNQLGFAADGWAAVHVPNPEASPADWAPRVLEPPDDRFGIVVGSSSVVGAGGFVHAFGTRPETREVFLARWPDASVAQGDLSGMAWWCGDGPGWVPDDSLRSGFPAAPWPVFSGGQMEFSVEYVPARGRWLQVQTQSILDPRLAARWAERLTGPWGLPAAFYRPEAAGQPTLLVYAGKAHPECSGAPLVLTYAVNTLDAERILGDTRIYYPEFLKGRLR